MNDQRDLTVVLKSCPLDSALVADELARTRPAVGRDGRARRAAPRVGGGADRPGSLTLPGSPAR